MMNTIIKKEKEEQLKELHITTSSSVNAFSNPGGSTSQLISSDSNATLNAPPSTASLNGNLNNNIKDYPSNEVITMETDKLSDCNQVANGNANIEQADEAPVGFYLPQPEVSKL